MVAVDHNAVTVYFQAAYVHPVVIAGAATHQSGEEVVVRVQDVRRNSFSVYVQESRCRDNVHTTEQVAWMVVEKGKNIGRLLAQNMFLSALTWHS